MSIPVLRKDFTVDPRDVCDARLMGADAVLLIVAALDDRRAGRAPRPRRSTLGLDVLVEVHDEAELDAALAVGATVVGVNQRDLVTFEVDTERAVRVAAAMPTGAAGGGVGDPRTGRRRALAAAGFHAVLVGESVVTADDPAGGHCAAAVCRVATGRPVG